MNTEYENKINWKQVKGAIFDVDGTLYDQRKLRIMMLTELCRHVLLNKNALLEIKVLSRFRKLREVLAEEEENNVSSRQLNMVADTLSISPERVADIVERWIYKKPLKYMQACRFEMVDDFFDALRKQGIKIGIFSDYPIEEKLASLRLSADAVCYSLETGIDRLKPQTAGLETIVKRLSLGKSECVLIGDRDSRDGVCARRFGMPFALCRGRDFYKKMTFELAHT